jgi:hypothetical protein
MALYAIVNVVIVVAMGLLARCAPAAVHVRY